MASSLSEDQKRRIELEEQSRLAEETYREEVRRSLHSPESQVNPAASSKAGTSRVRVSGFILTLALLLGGLWIASVYRTSEVKPEDGTGSSKNTPLVTQWLPVTAPLVSGQFQVRAQNYSAWNFIVPAVAVRNYRVNGHYSVIGGSGNDIQAVIATEDEFQNWINGHQSRTFYASPGKVTTGNVDLVLPPGRYVLALDNRFSLLTDKAVLAEIKATYEQMK